MTSEIKFVFKGRLFKSGGSMVLIVPAAVVNDHELKEGDCLDIAAMEGRHGKFVGFWKSKEQG